MYECFEILNELGAKLTPVSFDTTLRNYSRAFVTILVTRCRGQSKISALHESTKVHSASSDRYSTTEPQNLAARQRQQLSSQSK